MLVFDQEAVTGPEGRAPDRQRQGAGHHRRLEHLQGSLCGVQEVGPADRHHRAEGRHGHRPDRGAVEEDDRRRLRTTAIASLHTPL